LDQLSTNLSVEFKKVVIDGFYWQKHSSVIRICIIDGFYWQK